MKKLLLSFAIFSLVSSCAVKEEPKIYSTVNELANGHYAQLNIGDTAELILSSFADSLVLSNTNEIVFLTKTKDNRIEKRETRTALDRGLIYEIAIDFYLKQDSLVLPFFTECKAKLDELYGSSKMDDGYAAWSSSSIHNKVIEIELFDESINSELKMVSINFYEDFDKSFYAE